MSLFINWYYVHKNVSFFFFYETIIRAMLKLCCIFWMIFKYKNEAQKWENSLHSITITIVLFQMYVTWSVLEILFQG